MKDQYLLSVGISRLDTTDSASIASLLEAAWKACRKLEIVGGLAPAAPHIRFMECVKYEGGWSNEVMKIPIGAVS